MLKLMKLFNICFRVLVYVFRRLYINMTYIIDILDIYDTYEIYYI